MSRLIIKYRKTKTNKNITSTNCTSLQKLIDISNLYDGYKL